MSQPTLPMARLVRTAYDENGKSVFASDSVLPSFSPIGPKGSSFTIFDSRTAVPVNNQEIPGSFAEAIPRCPPNGAIFCMTDFKPGGRAPMHRTVSLDYAVVVSGEIVIVLEGGEERTVKQGEMIVQQGANHAWINRTDEVCRMVFVTLSADKVRLQDGTELDETLIKAETKLGL